MNKKLYHSNDLIELNNTDISLDLPVDTVADETTLETLPVTDMNKLVSSKSKVSLELQDDMTRIFTSDSTKPPYTIYFVASKSKYEFDVDGTIFEPNKIPFVNKTNLASKLQQQLEGHIYTTKDNIDENKLLIIMHIFNLINKGNFPIQVRSAKFRKLIPEIVKALNSFFNKNYSTLYSMYLMFNGIRVTENEQPET